MTTQQLDNDLYARGVRLEARGDRLVYDAPPGVLTRALQAELVAHKQEVLAILDDRSAEAVLVAAGLPTDLLVLDLETLFSKQFSLAKLPIPVYVHHPIPFGTAIARG